MIPRWYTRTRAFASPEAGFDYFLTEAHYRSLGARIIATLGGFDVVVVTGDPPPNPQLLSNALTEAAVSHHTVVNFSCRSKPRRDELLSLRNRLLDPPNSSGTPGTPLQCRATLVLLVDDISQLSDVQVDEFLEIIYLSRESESNQIARAIFLAAPDVLARLERPALRLWLAERLLVARLRLQELGEDEVLAFIRHQLPLGEAESALTEQAVAAIADVSGGDPVLVNRFSRRLLGLSAGNAAGNPIKAALRAGAAAPVEPPTVRRSATTRGKPSKPLTVPNFVHSLRTSLSQQVRRNLNATLRISFVILVYLVAFGGSGALFPHPAEQETISAFTGVIRQVQATDPERQGPAAERSRPELIGATNAAPRPTTDLIESSQEAVLRPTSNPPASPAEIVPTVAMVPSTAPVGATSTAPALPKAQGIRLLPDTEIAALIAQGDRLLGIGDVASARLFYERAANAADGEAALKLARTFDPAFLRFSARLSTVRGDSKMAAAWYRRARDFGEVEAELPLKRLDRGFP